MKIFYKEEERVIHIVKENYGVTYLIIKGDIDLVKSFPFEANEQGRCIGFDVPKGLDLKEFDEKLNPVRSKSPQATAPDGLHYKLIRGKHRGTSNGVKRFAKEKGLLVTGERK